jgi:hypothetical protein
VDIARRVSVQRLLVVRVEGGHATARLFLPETSSFDAAAYAPDEGTQTSWAGTTASLLRSFGPPPPPPLSAPPLATHPDVLVTSAPPASQPFYMKGWFWGAVGAAAFAGGAIFFATRDNGPSSIHLTMQVP